MKIFSPQAAKLTIQQLILTKLELNRKEKGFLLLDVLSVCALIALISLMVFTANHRFNTTLRINKVRTAAEILAQDLRRLQRKTIFHHNEKLFMIRPNLKGGYNFTEGTTIKKTILFKDIGCDGVYFSKSLNIGRFSNSGAPAYTGDYVLKHQDLPNYSCTLSLQPVTGRVIIIEGQ